MSELHDLEEHVKVLKKQIELKNQTEILLDNQEFKAVILQGFCEDEMHRNMGLSVCDKLPLDIRELCNNLAKASAALHNYLNTTIQLGVNAEEDLEVTESRILELQTSMGVD
jgi:hypothetical protein